MSHGLLESDTMFTVRTPAWHGLGTVLATNPRSAAEALKLAGLDWEVSKQPVYVRPGGKGAYVEAPDHFAVMRNTDNAVLGVVSDRYVEVQNVQAFRFLDAILGEIIAETAGSLWGGRRVWLMCKLPEHVEIAGDQVVQYILITTTHDGTGSVAVYFVKVRVVCQNTMTAAISGATASYKVRHLGSLTERTHEARQVLGMAIDYSKQFDKIGLKLASKKMTERKLQDVLDKLYPAPPVGCGMRTSKNRESTLETVKALFVHGQTVGNAPGSAWSAYNAIVETRDHYSKATGEGVFRRQIEDPAGLKARAFAMVREAVNV